MGTIEIVLTFVVIIWVIFFRFFYVASKKEKIYRANEESQNSIESNESEIKSNKTEVL